MRIIPAKIPITEIDTDAVVVGVYDDGSLSPGAANIDGMAHGVLSKLIESKEITGKRYELLPLFALPDIQSPQVLVVGLGSRDEMSCGTAYRAAAAASRKLAGKERQRVAFFIDEGWTPQFSEAALAGVLVGCRGQDLYRAEKKCHVFAETVIAGSDANILSSGEILGQSVNLARQLVDEPPSEVYPESFAARARQTAEECGLEIDVWDADRLGEERCGALLAVARGSNRSPRLVQLRHQGGPADQKPLALVGKGVTFDSGGLSLKPSDGMLAMKCDMAGAATVLGAMRAIARLNLPLNVLGLVGLVENMVSGDSYKLGDVLTARNGRTIEVHNTDAEGRLVLADVLCVAVDGGAAKIIDLATLTGACVVALGNDVVGAMTNDQSWCDVVLHASESCGEPTWQLPMFSEYAEQIKSDVADIKNVGEGRWGGAITAAKFLEEFVGEIPWVHLDIAGPAFIEKAKPWISGGGTGVMVRTLVEIARVLNDQTR